MRRLIRLAMPYVARLHWKNWRPDRRSYPQLWNCIPFKRDTIARNTIERLCGLLTGHELSATEWGWAVGSDAADRNCRWCDKGFQVPIKEAPKGRFSDLVLSMSQKG